jgi:peptide/nickel transport system substrate-binding protein
VVAALVVFSLSLFAAGKKEVTGAAAAAEGEPQYGGTLTFVNRQSETALTADIMESWWPTGQFLAPVLEDFIRGDVEKYGPGGTNEYPFNIDKMIPLEYNTGALAESWEVTADKIVLHIRKGVQWSGISINPGVMKAREYTADDAVFNLKRVYESSMYPEWKVSGFVKSLDSIHAKDKYTVVIETSYFHPEWWWYIANGKGCNQYPPEVIKAGSTDWNNLIGTGPFVMQEYVPGSVMVYAKNPNYWRKTTINGKQYQTPFVDKLVQPMINDKSTLLAALRTAKLDVQYRVSEVYKDTLAQTCPDLLSRGGNSNGTFNYLALRCDRPPFNNKEIRRAVMIGTDIGALRDAAFPGGLTYWWPIQPANAGHVPLEKLPASTRELFEYNPEKAKEMLKKAGYGGGFKVEIPVDSTRFERVTISEMLAGEWADLNIKAEVKPYDRVAFEKVERTRDYNNCLQATGFPTLSLYTFALHYVGGGPQNYAFYDNKYFNDLYAKALATLDEAKRVAMLEELFVIALDDAAYIPIATLQEINYWWPWVKNYSGEYCRGLSTTTVDLMWLDQDLKKKMGFSK